MPPSLRELSISDLLSSYRRAVRDEDVNIIASQLLPDTYAKSELLRKACKYRKIQGRLEEEIAKRTEKAAK